MPGNNVKIVYAAVTERANYLQTTVSQGIDTIRGNLQAAGATYGTMWVGQISHEAFNAFWNARLSPQLGFMAEQVKGFGGGIINFANEMKRMDGSST